VLEATI